MNFLALECSRCTNLLCSRRASLADYIEQRMLILRYGCMCPGLPRLRTSQQVADTLGLSKRFVDFRHKRWRERGCLFLTQAEKRAHRRHREPKLLPAERSLLISHDTLQAQAGLSLKERVVHIRQHLDIGTSVGALWKVYKDAKVRFKRVDLHNVNKLRRAAEISRAQWHHCDWLIRVLGKEKHVYWMDEASIHVWH